MTEKFIINPNLPDNPVSTVIIGEGHNEKIYQKLSDLGIKTVKTTCCTNVRSGIEGHADLVCCHLGENKILLDNLQKNLIKKLSLKGFEVIVCDKHLKKEYPGDVVLNCAFTGKYLFCNEKTVSAIITDFAFKNSISLINVKQGYTNCSIAQVSDRAIITDDISIGSKAEKVGIDCLIINKGEIKLKNHNYGFIGGCSGKIDKDKIVFNGNIKLLSDYKKIISFLDKHNVEPICLTDDMPEDIGGIIPITEFK